RAGTPAAPERASGQRGLTAGESDRPATDRGIAFHVLLAPRSPKHAAAPAAPVRQSVQRGQTPTAREQEPVQPDQPASDRRVHSLPAPQSPRHAVAPAAPEQESAQPGLTPGEADRPATDRGIAVYSLPAPRNPERDVT